MTNESPVPPLSAQAQGFKPGVYEHYKGGLYDALFVGRSSEAREEEFVVYRSQEKGFIWIRPLAMFLGSVMIDGAEKPRFLFIREAAYPFTEKKS